MSEIRQLGPISHVVESDATKRLIVIRYHGRVAPVDVEACAEKVADALAQMPRGFRLLVDLTSLESMDVACVPHLEEIMRLCDARGVSAVVRVVPEARRDIGLQIMSRFHYRQTVEFITCKTLEEAAAVLTEVRDDPTTAELPA